MRLIAFTLAAFFVAGPAAAQNWQEYSYPDYSFRVAFPANPQIEITTYPIADNRSVEAHVYSVRQNNIVFKVTVAELANTGLNESAVIDHAIKTLSQGGEIKIDIPARVSRVYGRQLSIAGSDGSRSSVAVFYFKGRLYQIEGIALPDAKDAGSYVIRFQQSLVFTGGETNRSGDVDREPRRACRGGPEGTDRRSDRERQSDVREPVRDQPG